MRLNTNKLSELKELRASDPDKFRSDLRDRFKKATSRSSWINYIVIFFSIYFVWNTGVAIRHNQKLETKLSTLENKAQLLEQANKNLELQKSYYSSKEYQEKALKENFNLVSPGENVLIIKNLPEPTTKTNNVFAELQELRKLLNQ